MDDLKAPRPSATARKHTIDGFALQKDRFNKNLPPLPMSEPSPVPLLKLERNDAKPVQKSTIQEHPAPFLANTPKHMDVTPRKSMRGEGGTPTGVHSAGVHRPRVHNATPPDVKKTPAIPPKSSLKNKKIKPHASNRILRFGISSAAIILLATTGYFGWKSWETTTAATEYLNTIREETDTSREGTDESTVSATEKTNYVVAADMPRYLRIPDIAVDARVLRMGVNSAGNIAAPRNISDTGWYDGSAKPGEGGTIFVDGHVQGPNQPGVFSELSQLQAGSIIDVELGNGNTMQYTIQEITEQALRDIDMAAVLGDHYDGSETLVLMTCAGQYDRNEQSYTNRTIVYATRVEQ